MFRDALYPLFAILYGSYYTYLLLSPVSTEVGAATAGVVAAALIGLVYLAPASYLFSRLLRRKFGTLHLSPSRLYAWVAVSVAVTGFAYSTGQVPLLSIATTNLVLCILTLGCILGTLALTRLESFCGRMQAAGWTANVVKIMIIYAGRALSGITHPLEIVRRMVQKPAIT